MVTSIGDGMYRVEHGDQVDIVYVAGPPEDRWAFVNGDVYRIARRATPARRAAGSDGLQALTAPMPATVLKVMAEPGTAVKSGDTIVILEAMKMELPIRAPADATVLAVHCREGELVQPDQVLVELA
jgi:biotin carboxyl carrier protein